MKNTIITIVSLAAMVLAGCSKSNPETVPVNENGGTCRLTVSLRDVAATKVTGQTSANEFKIQNVQILVFRAGTGADAGVLDACASKGFDTPLNYDASSSPYGGLSVDCTVGKRKIYVLVNTVKDYTSKEYGFVGTEAKLLEEGVELKNFAKDKLFMMNSLETNLSSGAETVDISVRRICASVILESVKNDMQSYIYREPKTFKIKSVYLTNVPASINLGLSRTPSMLQPYEWYAWMKRETDEERAALIYDTLVTEARDGYGINYGEIYRTVHTFYSFPNDRAPSEDKEWSPRATRLVVEASYYDGSVWRDCYYPVTLYDKTSSTGLEANKQYRVNLTIRRPGSDDPNKPVEFDTVSGSIRVDNWDTGKTYTEII